MDNYILKVLNEDETNLYKQFLINNSNCHSLKDIQNITKFPILFLPKDKSTIEDLCNVDSKDIYYLNNIVLPIQNNFNGITYNNFVDKNYNIMILTYYCRRSMLGCFRYIYANTVSINNNYLHTALMSKFQDAYILLKLIIDFKDIDQYIFKIYINSIL